MATPASYDRRLIFATVAAAVLAVVVMCAWQVLYLQKAHSTFEDYYAFRGCAQLLSRTADSGTCLTGSGQTIKIVLYDGRWFLDGDLPQCLIGWGSTCVLNAP